MGGESDGPAPPQGRAGLLYALSSVIGAFYWHKSTAEQGRTATQLNAAQTGTVVAKKDMDPRETITVEEAAGILGISPDSPWLKSFRRVERWGSVQLYRADILNARSEMDAAAG